MGAQDLVVASTTQDGVAARPAADEVVAGAAIDLVLARAAIEGVVAAEALDVISAVRAVEHVGEVCFGLGLALQCAGGWVPGDLAPGIGVVACAAFYEFDAVDQWPLVALEHRKPGRRFFLRVAERDAHLAALPVAHGDAAVAWAFLGDDQGGGAVGLHVALEEGPAGGLVFVGVGGDLLGVLG